MMSAMYEYGGLTIGARVLSSPFVPFLLVDASLDVDVWAGRKSSGAVAAVVECITCVLSFSLLLTVHCRRFVSLFVSSVRRFIEIDFARCCRLLFVILLRLTRFQIHFRLNFSLPQQLIFSIL